MNHVGGFSLAPEYLHLYDPAFLAYYRAKFGNGQFSTPHPYRAIYWHHSAAKRSQNPTEPGPPPYKAYTQVICQDDDGEGPAWVEVNANSDVDLPGHTFARNVNAVALCLASCAGGSPEDLGPAAPTPQQVDLLIAQTALVCVHRTIPVSMLMDHDTGADNGDFAEQAGAEPPLPTPDWLCWANGIDPDSIVLGAPARDPYGSRSAVIRWDTRYWVNPQTREVRGYAAPCPAGWVEFLPWGRAQVLLQIQRITKPQWASNPVPKP